MITSLESSIVAVLDSKNNIVGTGFVVSERLILTCAHVVSYANSGRGRKIVVRFHLNGKTQIARVSDEMWSDEEDIAVLEIETLPPM